MRYVAVIGLGNFGSTVARELTDKGAKVIAIDKDRERVEAIKESVSYAAALDSINQAALRSVGIQDVDVAVVCIGDDVFVGDTLFQGSIGRTVQPAAAWESGRDASTGSGG